MQRARRRKRKDYDVTTNDDEIMAVIDKMRQAANVRSTHTLNRLFIFADSGRQTTEFGPESGH